MSGYIGSKASVTLVDGYTQAESDAEFVAKAGDSMTGDFNVTGTVTATDFSGDGSALTGIEGVPAGVVIYQAANTAPTGFIKANGASLSTTTYANLFAAIGYTFGGSGSSFNVPDLRGEFIRGCDDGRGVDSGRNFGSSQTDELKSHTHYVPTWTYNVHVAAYSRAYSRGTGANSVTTGATGGTETRPRNVALLACIKY